MGELMKMLGFQIKFFNSDRSAVYVGQMATRELEDGSIKVLRHG